MKLKLYEFRYENQIEIIIDEEYNILRVNDNAIKFLEFDIATYNKRMLINELTKNLELDELDKYLDWIMEKEMELIFSNDLFCEILLKSYYIDDKLNVRIKLLKKEEKKEFVPIERYIKAYEDIMIFVDDNKKELFYTHGFLNLFDLSYDKNISFEYFLKSVLKKIYNQRSVVHIIKNKFNQIDEFIGNLELTDGKTVEFVYKRYKIDNFSGVLCTFKEVSKGLTRLEYDSKTDLFSSKLIKNEMDFLLEKAKENRKNAAVFLIRLTSLKNIRQGFGMEMSDYILKQSSVRIRRIIRKTDLIMRVTDDEFVMFVNEFKDAKNLNIIAKRVLDKISVPIKLVNRMVSIDACLGISILQGDQTLDILLNNCFTALESCLETGLNCYSFYEKGLKDELLHRIYLENDLKLAINNDEFIINYQPQLSVKEDNIIGVEALVRWHHPIHGMIVPSIFIPMAEQKYLIHKVGKIVLEKALRETKEVREKYGIKVSINVSPQQFIDEHFLEIIDEVIDDKPELIEFEITESLAVNNQDLVIEKIKKLKDKKIKISMDDFGTGYSSLSYLQNFPVDKIKIDKAFIDSILESEENESMVKAIIMIAENLKLELISEGVENEAQLHKLMELGCDEFQGYFFEEAISIGELEKNLENKKYKSWVY